MFVRSLGELAAGKRHKLIRKLSQGLFMQITAYCFLHLCKPSVSPTQNEKAPNIFVQGS
ncbi:MAG: hypothetical protein ACJA0G_000048 [Kangiellaceae bacterium]